MCDVRAPVILVALARVSQSVLKSSTVADRTNMSNQPQVLAWREEPTTVAMTGGDFTGAGRLLRAAARFAYLLLAGPF